MSDFFDDYRKAALSIGVDKAQEERAYRAITADIARTNTEARLDVPRKGRAPMKLIAIAACLILGVSLVVTPMPINSIPGLLTSRKAEAEAIYLDETTIRFDRQDAASINIVEGTASCVIDVDFSCSSAKNRAFAISMTGSGVMLQKVGSAIDGEWGRKLCFAAGDPAKGRMKVDVRLDEEDVSALEAGKDAIGVYSRVIQRVMASLRASKLALEADGAIGAIYRFCPSIGNDWKEVRDGLNAGMSITIVLVKE